MFWSTLYRNRHWGSWVKSRDAKVSQSCVQWDELCPLLAMCCRPAVFLPEPHPWVGPHRPPSKDGGRMKKLRRMEGLAECRAPETFSIDGNWSQHLIPLGKSSCWYFHVLTYSSDTPLLCPPTVWWVLGSRWNIYNANICHICCLPSYSGVG